MEKLNLHGLRSCLAVILAIVLLFSAVGCTRKPNDAQIEEAIRTLLANEEDPPELVFEEMEVTAISSDRLSVAIWTQDKAIRRDYTFLITELSLIALTCSASVLNEDGTYSYVQPAPYTAYSERFGFTDNPSERVMVILAGEGDIATNIREQFEAEQLGNFSEEELASFKECDLGGETLILLVPKYEGTYLAVTVNGVDTGDAMVEEEMASSANGEPVYVWTDLGGGAGVQVYFGGSGFLIRINEDLQTLFEENDNRFIYSQ